jgi:glucose uptake protein
MNLPVEGDPLEISDYIRTPIKNHLLGALGGVVWALGAAALFVADTPKGDIHPNGSLVVFLSHAAPIVTALWGLLLWKEFKGGDSRAKAFAALMIVLFAAGLAIFSFAAESVR